MATRNEKDDISNYDKIGAIASTPKNCYLPNRTIPASLDRKDAATPHGYALA